MIEENGELIVMKYLIENLGGWPLIKNSYFKPNQNNTIKNMLKLYNIGINPLFNIYVSSSPSNPNLAILKVFVFSFKFNFKNKIILI